MFSDILTEHRARAAKSQKRRAQRAQSAESAEHRSQSSEAVEGINVSYYNSHGLCGLSKMPGGPVGSAAGGHAGQKTKPKIQRSTYYILPYTGVWQHILPFYVRTYLRFQRLDLKIQRDIRCILILIVI